MLQPVFNRPTQRIGMTYLTWVGTPNRLYGEDILSAPGWRHPPCILSCGNRYVASECNLLTTRAVYLKSWLFDWLSKFSNLSGPGVSLTPCCFVVYSTRRFVVCLCRFPLPLGGWEGLRFVIVALPGLFSDFFYKQDYYSHTRSGHTARCLDMLRACPDIGRCLGQMTQLWSITRHRFKPTQ